jgi:site-specific DNA-methyltransferase (adenine-specific)
MNLTDKITITNEDNMELMARYPDNYFDLAIVDPPYGINAPNMAATPAQRKNGNNRLNGGSGKLKNRTLNTAKIEWDNTIPSNKYFFRIKKGFEKSNYLGWQLFSITSKSLYYLLG